MQISPIDRQYAPITVTATLADGTTATVDGVDVALVRHDDAPGPSTTWTAASPAGGQWRVLLAGPYADATGAIVVPQNGADLWIRITDDPEIQAVNVERITVA